MVKIRRYSSLHFIFVVKKNLLIIHLKKLTCTFCLLETYFYKRYRAQPASNAEPWASVSGGLPPNEPLPLTRSLHRVAIYLIRAEVWEVFNWGINQISYMPCILIICLRALQRYIKVRRSNQLSSSDRQGWLHY